MTRLFAAAAASLAALALWTAPASAHHLQTKLDVAAHASIRLEQGYVIDAHLQGSDGLSISDATVRFYDTVDLFGEREMLIGAATTDGRGLASIQYLPAQTGSHRLLVRFVGRDHYSAADGRLVLDASVSAQAPRVEKSPLATFSDRVPYAVALIVLAVWGLIAFALSGTVRGVVAARNPERKEDVA